MLALLREAHRLPQPRFAAKNLSRQFIACGDLFYEPGGNHEANLGLWRVTKWIQILASFSLTEELGRS